MPFTTAVGRMDVKTMKLTLRNQLVSDNRPRKSNMGLNYSSGWKLGEKAMKSRNARNS